MVSSAYDRAQLWKDNEDFIVKLQSYTRMHIARTAYQKRMEYLNSQVYPTSLVCISALHDSYFQRYHDYFLPP